MGSQSFLHYPAAQPTEIYQWWLFRAHAHHQGFEVVFSAAIKALTLPLAQALLRDRLTADGFVLHHETALPLTDCLIDADRELAEAARQQGLDCVIGARGLASARDATASLPHLPAPRIETLAGLLPWSRHDANADAPAMPALADKVFFDRPARGNGLEDSVYAVIDGAKVFGLAERLSGSGLRHACLFGGKAAQDWGDVAPWLVQLGRHDRLTRQLFTRRQADHDTACLWQDGAAIFLRSPLGFEGMRAHLRRFTMVMDETRNTRLYFRFYDPRTVRAVLSHMPPAQLARILTGISCLLAPDPDGPGTLIHHLAPTS